MARRRRRVEVLPLAPMIARAAATGEWPSRLAARARRRRALSAERRCAG